MKRRSLALTAVVATLSGVVATTTSGATHMTYRAAIYSIRDDGSERRLIAEPDPPVSTLVRSPGGRSILFTRQIDGKATLFAAEPSGANAVRLTPPDLSVTTIDPAAAFSPDGRTIAFSSFVICGYRCTNYTLYVVNRDGSGLRRVAEGGTWPSWASDSRRFAFGAGAIYVHDIESQESTLVAHAGDRPVWAPRGERIAYTGLRGFSVACFVNADGSRRRCTRGSSLTSLVWSRDGKRVAFREATQRLGVVDSDARRIRYLAGNHGQHARPAAWSPDGRRLAYWFGSYGSYYGRVNVLRLNAPRRSIQVIDEKDSSLADLRWRKGRITYVVIRREAP
jgi:Tol biopolymer transport system component